MLCVEWQLKHFQISPKNSNDEGSICIFFKCFTCWVPFHTRHSQFLKIVRFFYYSVHKHKVPPEVKNKGFYNLAIKSYYLKA